MNLSRRTKAFAAVAGAASFALIATGCAAADDAASEGGPVELTIATFNDFGYTDELLQEYMDEHPNVTIVHNRAATSNDARANYFQKLGKEGLADIEAVEVDWFTEAMQYSDLLAEVPESAKGRWLDWKEAAATDADGRLVGFGTDIGPQGVCYRSDLFAAAGLPTDRAEVAALLDGDWDNFFDVADQYKAATGKPFIDSANSALQGIVNQLETAYEEPDGTIVATENADIEDAYNTVVERAVPIAAYAGQWSDDWFASMANGEFAAMLCPGWMHGVISGNAPDVTGWDIADVFPGGGGNWGGLLANPAIRLSHAISSLVDANGRIAVPGLRPPPIPAAVAQALADLEVGGGQDDPAINTWWGEPGLTSPEKVFGWNSLDVLTFGAGDPAKPVNAIPTNIRIGLQNLDMALPSNSTDDGVKELVALGYKDIDISLVAAATWNEAASEITLNEVSFQGQDMGNVGLTGRIGNVGKDLFDADTAIATVALVGAKAKALDLTVENKGLFERYMTMAAKEQKTTPESLRRTYAAAAAFVVPAMIGSSEQAQALSQAIARFIAKPGKLTINATPKDPAGFGIAEAVVMPDPKAILDRLNISAKAE